MPPGCGCPAAALPLPSALLPLLVRPCLLGCCLPCLACFRDAGSAVAFAGRPCVRPGPALAEGQLASCTAATQLRGPMPGATPHPRHSPGAVATAPAGARCGVRGWLVAAADYQQGPAGHGHMTLCMHVKTGMHMRPGQGPWPAWSCIYCKRLALLPSTSTGRPGQRAVQVAGVHPKEPPDLPQAPGRPPGYGI